MDSKYSSFSSCSTTLAGANVNLQSGLVSEVFNGSVSQIGGKIGIAPIPLGTADFMIHHIHAFQIHVTLLILLKGVLFARSSRLIPDKSNLDLDSHVMDQEE